MLLDGEVLNPGCLSSAQEEPNARGNLRLAGSPSTSAEGIRMVATRATAQTLIVDVNAISTYRSPLKSGLKAATQWDHRTNQAIPIHHVVVSLRTLQNLADKCEIGVHRAREEDAFARIEAGVTSPTTSCTEQNGRIETTTTELIDLRVRGQRI